MKNTFTKLVLIMIIIGSSFFLTSCVKEEEAIINASQENMPISRLDDTPGWHWFCRSDKCDGAWNGGWRSYCWNCLESYSPGHDWFIAKTFQTALKEYGDKAGGPMPEFKEPEGVRNRIFYPRDLVMNFPTDTWYEMPKCIIYYNRLKNLQYYSDPMYAEGVDIGWYRTVRALYPKFYLIEIQTMHSQWLVSEGRFMKDSKGVGLKDGTKAAIDAFASR